MLKDEGKRKEGAKINRKRNKTNKQKPLPTISKQQNLSV
jgi:hypothetical protein